MGFLSDAFQGAAQIATPMLIDQHRSNILAERDAALQKLRSGEVAEKRAYQTSERVAGQKFEAEQSRLDRVAGEELTKGFTPEEVDKARRIKAGLVERAVGSASQTIAAKGTTEQVATSQAEIAGAKEASKEESKLKKQLKFKPEIAKAVKLAEEEAAAKGETLTDLNRMNAALPGLKDAISQLKELAPIATSTVLGNVWDSAVHQTGFGSTKGANARIKFIALVNNQVLPLLKPTFGAAFTVPEGESLRATMGDPDATPDQKVAQLEVFIDQKVRNIETKQRELGMPEDQPKSGELTTQEQYDALPSGAIYTEDGQEFRKP